MRWKRNIFCGRYNKCLDKLVKANPHTEVDPRELNCHGCEREFEKAPIRLRTDDEGSIENATWKDEPAPPRPLRLLEKVCDLAKAKINGVEVLCSPVERGQAFYVLPNLGRETFALYWRKPN